MATYKYCTDINIYYRVFTGNLVLSAACLFELKMATKSLLRESKKCEKEEKAQKAKLKAAITKNNMEVY